MEELERAKLRRKQNQDLLARYFGLDRSLWDKYSLKNFEVMPGNELAFKTALEYLQIPPGFNTDKEEYSEWSDLLPKLHHFLTFTGDCGRGKTHLAIGLGIWQITEWREAAIYWQVPELLSALRRGFEDDSAPSYQQIMANCKSAELLILDDLGMQKNTDWAIEQLDSLIDYRYVNDDLLTVFTTNLKPSSLPPRIASRIREGEVVVLTGPDYRELKAKRRIENREVQAEAQKILSKGGKER